MKRSMYWLGLLAALSMPSAQAANQEIRASFEPDPAQPNKNVFSNQTPNSGYCVTYPAQCAANNMFSIRMPMRFNASRFITPGEQVWVKAPANWRKLTVTNVDTLETETVEVRISGIGSDFFLPQPVTELVGIPSVPEAHDKLWTTSGWLYTPAPCESSGMAGYTNRSYRFFWKTPVEAACTKVAAYRIPEGMYFDTLDFAYELRTPNPLGMSAGVYTGALSYTLGFPGDLEFGPLMVPDDNTLTLNFSLDVHHTLKVDLPPGGDKVTLEPEGGWQQWIDGGRMPSKIFRDQPFYLSASSRFKVMLQCESFGTERCNMYGGGNASQLTVSITLPDGISTSSSGSSVKRHPLRNGMWSMAFYPSRYIESREGLLHFEMPSDAIRNLLRPGQSASLSADITIIWDSEV